MLSKPCGDSNTLRAASILFLWMHSVYLQRFVLTHWIIMALWKRHIGLPYLQMYLHRNPPPGPTHKYADKCTYKLTEKDEENGDVFMQPGISLIWCVFWFSNIRIYRQNSHRYQSDWLHMGHIPFYDNLPRFKGIGNNIQHWHFTYSNEKPFGQRNMKLICYYLKWKHSTV